MGTASKDDLFISYAHVDNKDGWVRQFISKLGAALAIRNGGKPLKIFSDKSRVNANNVLDDILDAARQSKLFLAIGSRAYVGSERFTLRELAAFCDTTADQSRVFVIETLPLRDSDMWPEAIAHHARQSFFVRDEELGMATTLTQEVDGLRYMREIHRLAEEIVRKLGQLSDSVPEPVAAGVRAAPVAAPARSATCADLGPGFECKRVLIAQPTDALEEEVADLRAYLEKFGGGMEILPRRPYPQGGAEFKAAYLFDLDQADLVVNLLDRRTGRCPPDLEEGYTMFQLNAARAHGVAIMQWRDPRIDLAEIANPEFLEVLNGPEVIACGFNEFKEEVRKSAITPVAKDRPPNGAIVYVHASPNDKDMALRIGENCGRYKLFCHLPQFDQRTINTRAVQDRLSSSNAVLFLYCNADTGWAEREAETIYKYSRRDGQQMIALCFGPPEKSETFIFPDARIIKGASEGELIEKIDSLLRELAA